MIAFSAYNVKFRKHSLEDCVVVTGEIINESNKDYDEAVFRINIFGMQHLLGAGFIKIKGFRRKHTKAFEVLIRDMRSSLLTSILRFDIQYEGGY